MQLKGIGSILEAGTFDDTGNCDIDNHPRMLTGYMSTYLWFSDGDNSKMPVLPGQRYTRLNSGGRLIHLAVTMFLMLLSTVSACYAEEAASPERVTFPSADGKTMLVGYLYKPAGEAVDPYPAVVLMHGRSGAYSSKAKGVYNASTLSLRHKAWGLRWAEAGYIAILVDGFGPRGYPEGFPRFSYDERPPELNEVTNRPYDAYGALSYLRSRSDVAPNQIGLMGWSNGASATLATMSENGPGTRWLQGKDGFRAALAFYPGCRLKGWFDDSPIHPYAPVLILHGTDDEEVSYEHCVRLVDESQSVDGQIEIELFDEATHSFDTPTRKRQALEANRQATDEASSMALEFFYRYLRQVSEIHDDDDD